ncbi:MAG: enoyl-CoA hydratase/isomerase family protein [Chloroflexi bacterium]|nr:enoyl-CoA hydratase/isomerase family protein [Chloroflexota bacterium]
MGEYLIFEKDPKRKVATVTLNRPEVMNAFRKKDEAEVIEVFRQVEEDDDVKVVVLRGAGRSFCSGRDVSELAFQYGIGTGKPGERRASQRARILYDRNNIWGRRGMIQTILHCLKITIAQVHGYCYGGGTFLALACDLTIAAEGTLFTHPGWRYIGPHGDIALYIETMGIKRAKEMILTGRPFTAQEALQSGLINRVVPPDRLEEEANQLADTVAKMPLDGIVMGKAQFEACLDALGVGTGSSVAVIGHSLETNIRYEEGEFNLLRERRNKGVRSAIHKRIEHFQEGAEGVQ